MPSGKVHRDRHHFFSLRQSILQIFQYLIQNGKIHLGHKSVSLKDINKSPRHYHRTVSPDPSDQCFSTHYFSGVQRNFRLQIRPKFLIIVCSYHTRYDLSGILQILTDLLCIDFHRTVYLLGLALFSGLIGVIHHGGHRPVILQDFIHSRGNDQIALVVAAVGLLHKSIGEFQIFVSGLLHRIFLQHSHEMIRSYTTEQYAVLALFLQGYRKIMQDPISHFITVHFVHILEI